MALGKEWRHWRNRDQKIPQSPVKAGVLELNLEQNRFSARFAPSTLANEDASVFNLALLGCGMTTRVRGGENRGKQLNHDFVVLDHRSFTAKEQAWHGDLPESELAGQAQRLAWVAWVSRPQNLAPVQALGAWADNTPQVLR